MIFPYTSEEIVVQVLYYRLTRSFVLLDAGSGISSVDEIGLKMMEEFKIPYVVSRLHCMLSTGSEIMQVSSSCLVSRHVF